MEKDSALNESKTIPKVYFFNQKLEITVILSELIMNNNSVPGLVSVKGSETGLETEKTRNIKF